MILEIGAPREKKMKMAVRACARSRPARGRGEIRAVRGFKVVYDGRVAALEEEKRKMNDVPSTSGRNAVFQGGNGSVTPHGTKVEKESECDANEDEDEDEEKKAMHAQGTGTVRSARASGDLPAGGVTSATTRFKLPRPEEAVRNLMEQARYGHLCTITSKMHHRRSGFPYGAVVELAVDASGAPIISLSPLAVHARNLRADARSTLVIQMPGWSGLANARATLFGEVSKLPDSLTAAAKDLFAEKSKGAGGVQRSSGSWAGRAFFRMKISDIYFVGGFGTEKWIDAEDYRAAQPDAVVVRTDLQSTLEKFTMDFQSGLRVALDADDAVLVSIDARGVDARVRRASQFGVERLSFAEENYVETADDAASALKALLKKDG